MLAGMICTRFIRLKFGFSNDYTLQMSPHWLRFDIFVPALENMKHTSESEQALTCLVFTPDFGTVFILSSWDGSMCMFSPLTPPAPPPPSPSPVPRLPVRDSLDPHVNMKIYLRMSFPKERHSIS